MDTTSVTDRRTSKIIGSEAEQLALSYLLARGLKLIEKNFNCKFGEIDLVMQHRDSLVFVEVRFRRHQQYGTGADSVNYHKQKKLLKTAEFFLQHHVNYRHCPCRIDVVSIGPDKSDIDWITNAVEA